MTNKESEAPLPSRVSVVICTRNRSALLDRCLRRIADVATVAGDPAAEILVVDNGSTDDTAAVAERWSSTLDLRCVSEPRRGLSNARNRAIEEADGEILAFLDDDVLVTDTWLPALRAGFDQWPSCAGLAGRVDLEWTTGRPTWLPATRETFFARTELGDDARLLNDGESPVGANMAVRSSVAAEVGAFDARLGYSGTSLLGNEEVDFFRRVRTAGYRVAYHPEATVNHVVDADRATRSYLLRRLYSQGRSDVRMEATDIARATAARAGAAALGRALVRGWRGDIGRLQRPGSFACNAMEVATGRARQAGRARELMAIARHAS